MRSIFIFLITRVVRTDSDEMPQLFRPSVSTPSCFDISWCGTREIGRRRKERHRDPATTIRMSVTPLFGLTQDLPARIFRATPHMERHFDQPTGARSGINRARRSPSASEFRPRMSSSFVQWRGRTMTGSSNTHLRRKSHGWLQVSASEPHSGMRPARLPETADRLFIGPHAKHSVPLKGDRPDKDLRRICSRACQTA